MPIDLSKENKEHLLEICSRLKQQPNINPDEITELEDFIKCLKYGLVFEQHEEEVDRQLKTCVPAFIELENKNLINNPDSSDCNFLLEGDNLHSLKLLEKTHEGRIDVIYIDPPYNTGNEDFIYADKMIDTNDGFRHSKWLSFMKERLVIARRLLADDGVIFISIDDNEQANLKLLCNSVFGEDNFVTQITVETAHGVFGNRAKQANKTFCKTKEYLLIYTKKTNANRLYSPIRVKATELFDTHYNKYIDENNEVKTIMEFILSFEENVESFDKFKLKKNIENVSKLMEFDEKFKNFIYNNSQNIYRDCPYDGSVTEDISDRKIHIINGKKIFQTSGGNICWYKPLETSLAIVDENKAEYVLSIYAGDLWTGFDKDMKNVAKEGGQGFKNAKKPVRFIKRMLKWIDRPNATVLDFFAGSGTTGQAVLELNKEDGGNRHFILCTNNEISKSVELQYIQDNGFLKGKRPKKGKKNLTDEEWIKQFKEQNPEKYRELTETNKEAYEEYGICRGITWQRLRTVITGKKNGEKYSDGIPANLKYFKTDMIEKDAEDLEERLEKARECLDCIREMKVVPEIKEEYYEEYKNQI